MFAGEFEVTLDEKNRLVLPAKFRMFVGEADKAGLFVMVKPTRTEKCLRLCPPSYMESKVKPKLLKAASKSDSPEEFLRAVTSQMEFAPLDTQCRFVVPGRLADHAGLEKSVLLVGMTEWIEVWNPKEWQAAAERSLEKHKELLDRALWAED